MARRQRHALGAGAILGTEALADEVPDRKHAARERGGEPVLIVNGMIIGYGSGEETKQVWPDIGLQFDSMIRAEMGTNATIYVLDAQTGRMLWSSGEQIAMWNHFSSVTVANGRIYLGTYDGVLYCFGVSR